MRKPTIGKCVAGGVALLLLYLGLPIALRARRPAKIAFTVDRTYSRGLTVEEAFELSAITRDRAVSEGPCPGNGCNGGVVSPLAKEMSRDYDVLSTLPTSSEGSSIIWLYQIRPTEIVRNNDPLGDDTLTIRGKKTGKSEAYFALVPSGIVEPHLYSVYVETGE